MAKSECSRSRTRLDGFVTPLSIPTSIGQVTHGADVHRGPAFLPWHRELCNRLEALLREVDLGLSLHYWDWTTDPHPTLFVAKFMGNANGNAGFPLQNFESTEGGTIYLSVA